MSSRILMTQKRREKIQQQLNKLKKEDFPHNRHSMKEAIESGGGMHDNAAYEHALQDERLLLSRISELESVIEKAQIITTPISTYVVQIGHRVLARDIETGRPYEITITGYMDTDLDNNRISYNAPLAQCFIGKQVGDIVRFVSPVGEERSWEILEIQIANIET